MKKTIVIAIISFIIFYVIKEKVYKPYMWKKAMNTKEHQLQLGSFIFSKQRGTNGSQSYQNYYFVFKVVEISGDFVRLSVVRRLSKKDVITESDFSTTSKQYKALQENVEDLVITPIATEDLYHGDGPRFTLNDYLLQKYPALHSSPYYYEASAENVTDKLLKEKTIVADYDFSLIYSKKEIIEKGLLTPYTINQYGALNKPVLSSKYAEHIDLIKN